MLPSSFKQEMRSPLLFLPGPCSHPAPFLSIHGLYLYKPGLCFCLFVSGDGGSTKYSGKLGRSSWLCCLLLSQTKDLSGPSFCTVWRGELSLLFVIMACMFVFLYCKPHCDLQMNSGIENNNNNTLSGPPGTLGLTTDSQNCRGHESHLVQPPVVFCSNAWP